MTASKLVLIDEWVDEEPWKRGDKWYRRALLACGHRVNVPVGYSIRHRQGRMPQSGRCIECWKKGEPIVSVPHPLGYFEKDEITSYVNALVDGAKAQLISGNVAGAAWRLADALGALSFVAEEDTGGIDTFTGLGFKLQKVQPIVPEEDI